MVPQHLLGVLCVLLPLLLSGVAWAGEPGLVAHYTFEEGSGDLLRDHSGNDNHGQIQGARWVRNGAGWALEFDGVDDHVDCGAGPSLDLRDALTLEAWIYAEPIYSVWMQVPIVGKEYGSYAISQWVGQVCSYAKEGWGLSELAPRRWVHVAESWDGEHLRFFMDGRLAALVKAQRPLPEGGTFWMAGARPVAEGEAPSYDRRFKGRIASVKVYNRALTHEEILSGLRSTNITGSVIPSLVPLPGHGQILVEVDAARLGLPLDNIRVDVRVYVDQIPNPPALLTGSVKEFDELGRAVLKLDGSDLKRGDYLIYAFAHDAAGKTVGVPGTVSLSWPGASQFPTGPTGAEKLNNLVTELLRIPGPDSSAAGRTFVNPRLGWVYIANRGSEEMELVAEGAAEVANVTLAQDYGDAYETMRYLPQGKYTITVPVAQDLIVRAVPWTIYDCVPAIPHVAEFGPYGEEFHERYVLPHTNTFVLTTSADEPFVKDWTAQGRMMLPNLGAHLAAEEGQSEVDAAYEAYITQPGLTHPLCGGNVVDEFNVGKPCSIWAQAADRALSEPRFQGRVFHAFDYALFDMVSYDNPEDGGIEACYALLETLEKHDSGLIWECYVKHCRTELEAWRHINHKMVGEALAANDAYPRLVDNLIVSFHGGYVTAGPPWLTATLPTVDTRTYLDMQFHTLATHPGFQNLFGLLVYRSNYADEETIRWAARLFRHYGIEGRTEMLGKDPYLLTHVQNPDFEYQDRGWELAPAAPGGISFDVVRGFSGLQGRYGRVSEGNTVLVTTRSDQRPNVFSQEIKGLEPGRLYSLRLFSADHQDTSKEEEHAVTIKLANATLVPSKCFTHLGGSRDKTKWLNYHYRVFRAEGQTATLAISDWANEGQPGGPIGQELMYNYIKVQPYWSE